MKCYKCKAEHNVKAGFVRGMQRYKCKECGCCYTVEKKANIKTPEEKQLALHLHAEGFSFRAIGKALNISYGTVFHWVKKEEAQAKQPHEIQ